jgi:hypothetical protein
MTNDEDQKRNLTSEQLKLYISIWLEYSDDEMFVDGIRFSASSTSSSLNDLSGHDAQNLIIKFEFEFIYIL